MNQGSKFSSRSLILSHPFEAAQSRIGQFAEPEPHFLPGSTASLFGLYYAPQPEDDIGQRDILFVPPFGEELNISRRQVARQARELTVLGYGVLLLDLFGCGDSMGELRDARWDIWRKDLELAVAWLRRRGSQEISLWGVRLGSLLALDFAAHSPSPFRQVVLWRPFLSGETMINNFLLLRLAAGEVSAETNMPETLLELRERLRHGEILEVLGYELSPELVQAIDQIQLSSLGKSVSCPIHWIEAATSAGASLPLSVIRIKNAWLNEGVNFTMYTVNGGIIDYQRDLFDHGELLNVMSQIFSRHES